MKKTVLLGPGGHASVVLNILKQYQDIKIIGFTDASYSENKSYKTFPVLGTDEILLELKEAEQADYAFITVGSIKDNHLREKLFEKIDEIGYKTFNIIDKSSVIAENVNLGKGNLISPGAIINPDVIIADNNIINTGSIIEHETKIGSHIHIAPGAVLAGGVKVSNLTHIGLGAKIIEGITIGENCLIGAGAVVINDIPDDSIVVGVPGEIIKKR
jgi:UDP-perosamine 4-acetyltransferase